MTTAWGIDLGTTNSAISLLRKGKPEAVQIDDQPTLPSVVLYDGERVLVGRQARNLELSKPECCVRSVKRRMGRGPAYSIAGRERTPEQVSAEILTALKNAAEESTGLEVRDVVITVPAYFDDAQRRATLEAGKLAGLHVLRLLNEPTSASLVYDRVGEDDPNLEEPEITLVYDLGGGTFDVSVIEVFGDVREVRATAGNSQLGGDDIDELLYRRFRDHLKLERGVDVDEDPRGRAKLRLVAERTKIALSAELETLASEEFVATDAEGAPIHLSLTVTRTELEKSMSDLLDSTLVLTRQALEEAKLEEQSLSRICLVGGSTRIPKVRSLLRDAFPDVDIHEEIDPDLAVTLGASIQAGLLSGADIDRILVDVAAHSLGMLAIGEDDDPWSRPDTFVPILPRNTSLPAQRSREFYTMVDNQERVDIEVFQGESNRASQNHPVGSFVIELEECPARSRLEAIFAYDLDGMVRVTIKQMGTSNRKTVRLAVADASAQGKTEGGLDPALLKKARAMATLLEESADPDGAEFELLIEKYEATAGGPIGERDVREEDLLDALADLEDDLDPNEDEEELEEDEDELDEDEKQD